MQTKAKSNSVITHEVVGQLISFNVREAGSITLDLGKVANANRERAEVHGFIQRISDAAAISRDPLTGKPASPTEKLEAMRELVEHYESGSAEWSRRREGGMGATGGLLFRALRAMYDGKRTDEQLREFLDKLSRSEQTALLVSDKVKPFADAIRAEAGKGVDAEALLAGL